MKKIKKNSNLYNAELEALLKTPEKVSDKDWKRVQQYLTKKTGVDHSLFGYLRNDPRSSVEIAREWRRKAWEGI